MGKLLGNVIKGIRTILRIFLMITVALICLQIIWRYVIGKPLTWTEQICRFLFIWMMMLGIPVLFYEKQFMAFDLILNALGEKKQKVITVFIDIVICLFALFWLFGTTKLCLGTMNKMTSGVRINYFWLYGAQGVSALMIFWVMAVQTVEGLRGMNVKDVPESTGGTQ